MLNEVNRVLNASCRSQEGIQEALFSGIQAQQERAAAELHRQHCEDLVVGKTHTANCNFLELCDVNFKKRAIDIKGILLADCSLIDHRAHNGHCLPAVGETWTVAHAREGQQADILHKILFHPLFDDVSVGWCKCFGQANFAEFLSRFRHHLSEAEHRGTQEWDDNANDGGHRRDAALQERSRLGLLRVSIETAGPKCKSQVRLGCRCGAFPAHEKCSLSQLVQNC